MKELKEDIKSGSFKRAYLLYGEEEYLKLQYKNELKKALIPDGGDMNLVFLGGKDITPERIIDEAETLPFFADYRLIIIEESGFFKKASPKLEEYLPQLPETSVLLFVEKEVDKRLKLFKTLKKIGREVEMKHPDEKMLGSWILGKIKKERKQISRGAYELFFQKTGDDMVKISAELEKLLCYCLDKDEITADDVEAVCIENIENRIFEMIRYMAEKNRKKTLELYYDLLSLKEAPLKILALVSRQFNQLLCAKDLREQGKDKNAIAQAMGISPYIAGKILQQSYAFTLEEIRHALEYCLEMEEGVKNGRIADRLAVELVLVSV